MIINNADNNNILKELNDIEAANNIKETIKQNPGQSIVFPIVKKPARDWRDWVDEETKKLRHEQIKETFSKPKEQRTEIELGLINSWIYMYGKEI